MEHSNIIFSKTENGDLVVSITVPKTIASEVTVNDMANLLITKADNFVMNK